MRRLTRWRPALGPGAGRSILALADQAAVSGFRFGTTVIVGRQAGADELGAYALGFTFLVLFACVQDSLVTLPFTVFCRGRSGMRGEIYAGTVLFQALIVAALGTSILLVAGLIAASFSVMMPLAKVLTVLALLMPAVLCWEFARRFGFAQLRVREVLVLDLTTGALVALNLGMLVACDRLSAITAFMAVGGASGLTALVWLFRCGVRFRLRPRRVLTETRRHWKFGRWVLASEATFMARSYVVPWLVALMMDATATGVFAAYLTLVLLANPLLNGISNVLAPDLARAFANGGRQEVRRRIMRVTWAMTVVVSAFSICLILAGQWLVVSLYGDEFQGHQWCVFILAAGVLAEAIGMPAYNGLWAIQRPNVCFVACAWGLVATVGATCALTGSFGLVGAAFGYSLGKFVASAVQVLAFSHSVHPERLVGATA